jgi:hypothetical protein
MISVIARAFNDILIASMSMQRRVTVKESSRAIGHLQTGLLQSQVGLQCIVSHTVIGRLWSRYQQTQC